MTAPADSNSLFDSIAQLLPEGDREHFYRRMAHLRQLNPNDDLLQLAEAMGFLALLIRQTPPLIATERRSLETSLHETLASMEALHRNTLQSNTQIEARLLDLPSEIQASINADAIAGKIAESIRQSFVHTQLASVAQELQLHSGAITEAACQLASTAAALDDPHSGPAARAQHAFASMLANLSNAATHIRSLTNALASQIRQAIAFLCGAAFALGFLLGWFIHP